MSEDGQLIAVKVGKEARRAVIAMFVSVVIKMLAKSRSSRKRHVL